MSLHDYVIAMAAYNDWMNENVEATVAELAD